MYVHDRLPPYRKTLQVGKNGSKIPSKWSLLVEAGTQLLKAALKDSHNEKFVLLADTAIPNDSFAMTYDALTDDPRPVFDYIPFAAKAQKNPHGPLHLVVRNRHYDDRE